MFNLRQAIAEWKRKLQSEGRLEDGDTQELVSHLEDRIDALISQGMREHDAFEQAVRETGSPSEIGAQQVIARERKTWQVTRTFLPALAVSYLKIMARQFAKHRTHNWITVGGLSIGLASCLFITFYALHELSYDRDYSDRPIYRVDHYSINKEGIESFDSDGPIPLGPALKDDFPEVKNAVRFWSAYMPVLRANDKIFQENHFMFVDTTVFHVFDFKLISGNASSVFSTKNSIVISESMAKKYFEGGDAVGETLDYQGYPGGEILFTVTGIFEDLPGNTHFNFNFLASFNSAGPQGDSWGSFKPIWTYVELDNTAAAKNLSGKFSSLVDKYLADRKRESREMGFTLEPISSIHLYSKGGGGMKAGGSVALINIIVFTGILILIMSCVNFINISLAKMTARLKEVGMRKVFGAVHRQVVFQFVTEVAMVFIVSLIIAVLITMLCAPLFGDITGMTLRLQEMLDRRFISVLLAIFVFVVMIAGYVPARTVSGFTIQQAFGKKSQNHDRRFNARNVLIFFQIAISGMLIISALVVNDQLKFIESKDLGVDITNVVAIPFSDNSEAFDNKLRAISGVESVSGSQRLPVNTLNYDRTIVSTPGREGVVHVESSYISPDFVDTYDIKVLAGRNFDSRFASDSNKFIINETAMNALGWNFHNAIGQKLTWATQLQGEVVGVVRDYHLESVHTMIRPMVMLNAVRINEYWQRTFISIRLGTEDMTSSTAAIEKLWREFNPRKVYQMVFMKDSYEQLHKSDTTFSRMIFYFTIIAIFISAIGLYAVSSYAAEQKRKEIGIRKVLGSGIGSITWKLAAPYVLITGVSLMIAIPTVYYLMTQWLMTFAYATSIHWYTILISVTIIIALTLVSVLKESLRAAMVNPVKFLRDE
jgi:putative ABC transport system permease protein